MSKPSLDDLTPEQRAAFLAFVKDHKHDYKWELSLAWMKGTDTPELRQIRNTLGPSWLAGIHVKKGDLV
jgi:hypothetical protein